MKTKCFLSCSLAVFGMALPAFALEGPFDPEQWPPTINTDLPAHFIVTDGTLFTPGGLWLEELLTVLTGGDQVTEDITVGGHTGKKVTGNFLNIADAYFQEWAVYDEIDILVQAYGDGGLFNAEGQPRNFTFLTGTLPELNFPVGGQVPVEAKNKRWNWILFRIANGTRPSDGTRFVGSIPANAQGAFQNGGVNGGTIRFEGVPNLIVRVVAFGAPGAFGEPDQINRFLPPEACDPEPETNLAAIDIALGTSNHMEVIDRDDQIVEYQDNVGPTGDKRRAVRPIVQYLNFGITDNHLGLPCNDPHTVKVCVEFYDDPEFAGWNVQFGPEAYATDDQGGIGFVPAAALHTMQGTGEWIRRSWVVPAVNLYGVNAAPTHTAGPRFVSNNGLVFVSSFQLAVLRTGTHPLAGQDPLEDCYADPNICTDLYGNYAELDLGAGVINGLDVGSSGGDQEMIVEEAGPAGDRRMAVRAAHDDGSPQFQHQFLNFAILDEALGPNSQPNAHLAICMTYYDDPALAGTSIRPEVYQSEQNGQLGFAFAPADYAVTLLGRDKWKTAYWEITDMKFNGVNQGPQAAARFVAADAGDIQGKIAITRLRYGVIRPCGPLAGVNPLEDCMPLNPTLAIQADGADVLLSWPAAADEFDLQSNSDLTAGEWAFPDVTTEVVGEDRVARLPIGDTPQFFRLAK